MKRIFLFGALTAAVLLAGCNTLERRIEQNAAMKLFSWAAVIILPPTLVAGIFGMNFHYMPELNWHYGYPLSLALMLVTAVGPYLYFKRRGWI